MSQTTTPSGADVDPLDAVRNLCNVAWAKTDHPLVCKSADIAITAVKDLIARNAELEAEREALRAAAEKAHAFLTHNYWGNWTYMEGSEVYEELREHAKLLSDALARTPAKENDDG